MGVKHFFNAAKSTPYKVHIEEIVVNKIQYFLKEEKKKVEK